MYQIKENIDSRGLTSIPELLVELN